MNAFEKKIFSFCNKYNLFKNCKGLILAVSGGPDSMALLGFFEKNRDSFSFPLLCATVDHSIRRESEEEAAYVEKFCSKRGIPFESSRTGECGFAFFFRGDENTGTCV